MFKRIKCVVAYCDFCDNGYENDDSLIHFSSIKEWKEYFLDTKDWEDWIYRDKKLICPECQTKMVWDGRKWVVKQTQNLEKK